MKSTYTILLGVLFLFASCIDHSSSKEKDSKEKPDQEVQEMPLGDTLFLSLRENMTSEIYEDEIENLVEDGVLRMTEENGEKKIYYSLFAESKECRSELVPVFSNRGLMEVKLKLTDTFEDKDYLQLIVDIYTEKYNLQKYEDTVAKYDDYFTHEYHWDAHLKKENFRPPGTEGRILPGVRVEWIKKAGVPCKELCTTCEKYLSYSDEKLKKISYKFLGYFDTRYFVNQDRKLILVAEPANKRIGTLEILYLSQKRFNLLFEDVKANETLDSKNDKTRNISKKEQSWRAIREKEFKREI